MQTAPIGRAQDPLSESDPVKQLETRRNLIPWYLEHLSERRAELEGLSHVEPEHAHRVAHEYGDGWTTSSDYSTEDLGLFGHR